MENVFRVGGERRINIQPHAPAVQNLLSLPLRHPRVPPPSLSRPCSKIYHNRLLDPIQSLRLRLGLGLLPRGGIVVDEIVKRPHAPVGRRLHVHVGRDLHHHVRLLVSLPPFLRQGPERIERIGRLQQGTIGAADPVVYHLRFDLQVQHQSRLQFAPILIPQHQSPPRAYDASHVRVDRVEDLRLGIAERLLPLLLEYRGYGHARGPFEYRVRVEEVVRTHPSRDGIADGRFSRSHHPDEVEVASLKAGGEEAGGIDFEAATVAVGGGGGGRRRRLEEGGILERILDARIGDVGGGILPLESSGG